MICHDQYNLQNASHSNDSCYGWKFAVAKHLPYLLVKTSYLIYLIRFPLLK
jgi:hypothetical protein